MMMMPDDDDDNNNDNKNNLSYKTSLTFLIFSKKLTGNFRCKSINSTILLGSVTLLTAMLIDDVL